MAKVFAIANQKGGVGKTTTCINLAASLVATKRRVLLLGLEDFANWTRHLGGQETRWLAMKGVHPTRKSA